MYNFIFSYLNFVFLNLLVISNAYILMRCYFTIENFVDWFIGLSILIFSQIIFTQTLLGTFGLLFLKSLIFLNILILLITLYLSRNNLKNLSFPFQFENKFIFYINSGILSLFIFMMYKGISCPPTEYDVLHYHLPMVVEWLKTKKLLPLYTPFSNFAGYFPTNYAGYFPGNAELIFLWLIFPFHNDLLVNLGQFPFWILIFICMFNICKKLNLTNFSSLCSALLFIFIRGVIRQTQTNQIDLIFASLFLIIFNFLLCYYHNPKIIYLILSFITFGLFFGTKYSAFVYGLPLIFFLIYLIFKYRLNNKFIIILILLLNILFFGSYWYIRNFIITHNFLYPIAIKLFGRTIMEGMPVQSVNELLKRIGGIEFFFYAGSFRFMNLEIFLMICGIFVGLFKWWKNKQKNEHILYFYIFILPIILIALTSVTAAKTNNYGIIRFNYGAIALIYIGIGFLIEELNKNKILQKILIIAITVQCMRGIILALIDKKDLKIGIPLGISMFILCCSKYVLNKIQNNLKFSILKIQIHPNIILCLTFFLIGGILYYFNNYRYYIRTDYYYYIYKNFGKGVCYLDLPIPVKIAYTGFEISYPLYGRNLQNDVSYININKHSDYINHNYKGSPRDNPDYNQWLNNLKKKNIDYLIISDAFFPKEKLIEYKWLEKTPFLSVYSNESVNIYKILNLNRKKIL